MFTIRKSEERGHAEHGWLDSHHTFSFADYIDPAHMGYRSLRVINDDRIAGGQGFGMHGHRNMEIFSWIVEGGLTHRDSMGHEKTVHPGGIQYMSAGRGVRHSEFNASPSDEARLLQVWILPDAQEVEPAYADKDFTSALADGGLVLVASGDGRDGSIAMHADADVYAARLAAGASVSHTASEGRGVWIQVVKGSIDVGGHALAGGDALAVEGEASPLTMIASSDAEFLLFDLA